MAETPYHHYALYEPDAAPDLTATGEYNSAVMAIDADIHAEEVERKTADANLKAAIDAEAATRHDEDDRLDKAIAAVGRRVDNAEVEISANSADLTGIKGLTYGEQHVHFVENGNGEYSSPALEEIAEQMGQNVTYIEISSSATTLGTDALTRLTAEWPHVVLIESAHEGVRDEHNTLFPAGHNGSEYVFEPLEGHYSAEGNPYATGVRIDKEGHITPFNIGNSPYWSNVDNKPFTNIGSGLKVVSDALTLDATAIPKGITANTTWGELESQISQ